MTWTTPKTWASEPLTSSDLNTHVRDNLNHLKDPPADQYVFNDSADWSYSVSSAWADIDSTDLSLDVTTTGGDVLLHFHGCFNNATSVYLDFTVDGTRYAGDDGIGRVNTGLTIVSFTRRITGLSAGVHTFKMQWKPSTAAAALLYSGAGTANHDYHGQFWAAEIS